VEAMTTPWKDHPARKLLAKALKNGDLPMEMKPREVYDKCIDDEAFAGMIYDSTFTRRLRDLRKKEENSTNDGVVDWKKHPAKKFLVAAFEKGVISVGCSETMGPKGVWENYCVNHKSFAEMNYDADFTRRLKSIETNYAKRAKRKIDDQKAFDIFRANNPINWEGRWAGIECQKVFKQDISSGKYLEFKTPKAFYESRPLYQEFPLQKFRDHIYQELRLKKFNNYVKTLKKNEADEDNGGGDDEEERSNV